ncbi:hypothetical protein F4V43_06540 [Paenibacillus spiritus]|uniref:Uncharacterized protein n=1 Tax=Paenibacillus spiritus TaxID=2496557 RepID=A0A5J5GED5_9BACL|nr:hypothetical protein [Paenibacillus spiritus]KAA9006596.1 hypothetical protein F4V43_06540 [Paenibacillus spiritus]
MMMDDYLDLYNYAAALGDREWQNDLLEQMKTLSSVPANERSRRSIREWWVRFDEINLMLAELYQKLRDEGEEQEQCRWKEEIWELKLERIQLARCIQNEYFRIQ